MIKRVLTIGAYGFSAETFLIALTNAGVDLLIDIRVRRGMRGAAYAFASAARLQAALGAAGIAYRHAKELAPPQDVRDLQYRADAAVGVGKRSRERLSDEFVDAYAKKCLLDFDPWQFVDRYAREAQRPTLFCVERDAEACHRSLVAQRVVDALDVPVQHLLPNSD